MLAIQRSAVASNLVRAVQHKLIDYNNFTIFKKSSSIAYGIHELYQENVCGHGQAEVVKGTQSC